MRGNRTTKTEQGTTGTYTYDMTGVHQVKQVKNLDGKTDLIKRNLEYGRNIYAFKID